MKHTRPPDTVRRPKTLRYSQSRVEATRGARNGGASIHIPVPKSHHVPPPLRTHLAAGGLWPGHAPGSTFSPNPSSRGVDRSAGRVPTPERSQPAPPHRAQSAMGEARLEAPRTCRGDRAALHLDRDLARSPEQVQDDRPSAHGCGCLSATSPNHPLFGGGAHHTQTWAGRGGSRIFM